MNKELSVTIGGVTIKGVLTKTKLSDTEMKQKENYYKGLKILKKAKDLLIRNWTRSLLHNDYRLFEKSSDIFDGNSIFELRIKRIQAEEFLINSSFQDPKVVVTGVEYEDGQKENYENRKSAKTSFISIQTARSNFLKIMALHNRSNDSIIKTDIWTKKAFAEQEEYFEKSETDQDGIDYVKESFDSFIEAKSRQRQVGFLHAKNNGWSIANIDKTIKLEKINDVNNQLFENMIKDLRNISTKYDPKIDRLVDEKQVKENLNLNHKRLEIANDNIEMLEDFLKKMIEFGLDQTEDKVMKVVKKNLSKNYQLRSFAKASENRIYELYPAFKSNEKDPSKSMPDIPNLGSKNPQETPKEPSLEPKNDEPIKKQEPRVDKRNTQAVELSSMTPQEQQMSEIIRQIEKSGKIAIDGISSILNPLLENKEPEEIDQIKKSLGDIFDQFGASLEDIFNSVLKNQKKEPQHIPEAVQNAEIIRAILNEYSEPYYQEEPKKK